MDLTGYREASTCHILALPYPGRGHINPMMNLCKLLSSRKPDILVTFAVTEEWLGFIGSDPIPENMRFATIPNVIPSELVRAADTVGFFEAVMTKMEAPFERLIDRLQPPVTTIVTDAVLPWAIRCGNRRSISVAALWTASASVFSMWSHQNLLGEKGLAINDPLEHGEDLVSCIPGILSIRVSDIPRILFKAEPCFLQNVQDANFWLPKAQYLLLSTVYALEAEVVDVLKEKFNFPVYPVGPLIPYFELNSQYRTASSTIEWLNSQPKHSVLYISMGSFLSASNTQMEEIISGVKSSGVRYLWVRRHGGEASMAENGSGGDDRGFVVNWCDQLKVLYHDSIGGFLTHCGWNSTMEVIFSGVPVITFPLYFDQVTNRKIMVEDWKMGLNLEMKRDVGREEIARIVRSFMDGRKELSERAKEVQEICQGAIAKGGSSDVNIDSFIHDVSL